MATKPTIATVAVGQKISASLWNNAVYNDGNFWDNKKPVCYVAQTGAQSIPNNTLTAITFDSELIDTDGQHSTVSNTSRVVIGNTLGWYRITGTYFNGTNVSGTRIGAAIGLNGTVQAPEVLAYAAGTAAISVTPTALLQATASTDYVELLALQTSGVAANTSFASPFRSTLLVEYVGTLA